MREEKNQNKIIFTFFKPKSEFVWGKLIAVAPEAEESKMPVVLNSWFVIISFHLIIIEF